MNPFEYNYAIVPSTAFPSNLASFLTNSINSAFSSAGNKFGTSDVFNKLFISSTKLSSFI